MPFSNDHHCPSVRNKICQVMSWFYLLSATKTRGRKKKKKNQTSYICPSTKRMWHGESGQNLSSNAELRGPLYLPPPATSRKPLASTHPQDHPLSIQGQDQATFPLDIQHPLLFLLLYHSQQQANTLLTRTINLLVNSQPVWCDTSQRHLTRWLLHPSG